MNTKRFALVLTCGLLLCLGCSSDTTEPDTTGTDTTGTDTTGTDTTGDDCGHDVDPAEVTVGFNQVLAADGTAKAAQGRPFEEGDTLVRLETEVTVHNEIEYARVAAYMMPIRDALMCDVATTTAAQWSALTEVLVLNGIKTTQDLTGTPPEQFYSTDGIFEHLQGGEDFNPMMKYLEEAELELKCLAFKDFDFTNPEGDDHCAIHNLAVGSGLVLP
ncbi:MAG: hypothetical protein ACI9WU_000159 [Myxococcota bacterium]|jgi:hypothetical protein